ncbi:MAG TPA: hypothetical protein PLK99_08540, partial [Burkholderiales bacterium]|nr:hypothetical protein [Burkholderiales bacterium]
MAKKPPKNETDGPVLVGEETDGSINTPRKTTGANADTHGKPVQSRKEARTENFFERVRKIPQADWGTRYYLYVYRIEPVIDRLRSGETKYVMRYSEPVDEQLLLVKHGSGRYRLNLVGLKPTGGEGTEIARQDVDLLNVAFPPDIPKGEWVDDPRNKKWAWAKKVEPPTPEVAAAQQANSQGVLVDAMRTVAEIRRDAREELLPEGTAANPVAQALGMAKDLLSMRADNPMVDVMRDQLSALRAEITAERESNRRLMEARIQEPKSNGLENVRSVLTTLKDLVPEIKSILPDKETVQQVVSGGRRRSFWEELGLQVAPGLIDATKPLIGAIAARMMMPQAHGQVGNGSGAPFPTAPATLPPGQPAQPQAQPQPNQLIQFLNQITPPMMKYFTNNEDDNATEFAYWI